MTQHTKEHHGHKARFSQALSSRKIAAASMTLATFTMVPSLAQAHSGHLHSATIQAPSFLGTLQAGLMHPVTGLDHLFCLSNLQDCIEYIDRLLNKHSFLLQFDYLQRLVCEYIYLLPHQ